MSRSIILLVISLFTLVAPTSGQTRKTRQQVVPEKSKIAKWLDLTDTIPTFQGVNIMTDAVGPGWYVLGGDFFSTEAALEVNLLNRFFPILEVGYGRTNATNIDTELHYKTEAPYFRVGLNYNMQYKKKAPGYIYAGFRMGYTSFKYDVDGPPMTDPVWGGEFPFSYTGIKGDALWTELLVGVRTQIYKHFHLGWSFRYKVRLNVKDSPNTSPWYIPGFGASDNTTFGATYDLVYHFPWKRK